MAFLVPEMPGMARNNQKDRRFGYKGIFITVSAAKIEKSHDKMKSVWYNNFEGMHFLRKNAENFCVKRKEGNIYENSDYKQAVS